MDVHHGVKDQTLTNIADPHVGEPTVLKYSLATCEG